MNKLWFFGDSFTDNDFNRVKFRKEYDDYMGYKTKHFTDLLGDEFGMEISVEGIGGVDNDTIFEKIIENIENIEPEDTIVVNWTSLGRIRLTTADNEYPSYVLMGTKLKNSMVWSKNYGYVDIDIECLEKMLVNRDSPIFLNQILMWTKLLKHTFKNNKIVFWSPFMHFIHTDILTTMSPPEDFEIDIKKYENMGVKFNNNNVIKNNQIMLIDGHTNGGVKDSHYSEIGNHLISDLLFHELNKQ
jgi:hypothetical protein